MTPSPSLRAPGMTRWGQRSTVPWVAAVLLVLNFAGLAWYVADIIRIGHGPWDFPVYAEATTRLTDGTLYDWGNGYIYPYSPLFAWLFVPFASLGIIVWWGLHFACVALIPSWPWRIAILLSAGFWMDTFEGNVTAFFMLAGYWMVRGNRWAGWAFLVGSLLVPKPQFFAGCLWLVWKRPEYRRPLLWIVPAYALAVLATGYGFEWLAALPDSSHDIANPFQFLPSRVIGIWWLTIGIPLGVWLLWKDRPGWAGIAISLYAGPPQLLMLVMERDWRWLPLVPRAVQITDETHLPDRILGGPAGRQVGRRVPRAECRLALHPLLARDVLGGVVRHVRGVGRREVEEQNVRASRYADRRSAGGHRVPGRGG